MSKWILIPLVLGCYSPYCHRMMQYRSITNHMIRYCIGIHNYPHWGLLHKKMFHGLLTRYTIKVRFLGSHCWVPPMIQRKRMPNHYPWSKSSSTFLIAIWPKGHNDFSERTPLFHRLMSKNFIELLIPLGLPFLWLLGHLAGPRT